MFKNTIDIILKMRWWNQDMYGHFGRNFGIKLKGICFQDSFVCIRLSVYHLFVVMIRNFSTHKGLHLHIANASMRVKAVALLFLYVPVIICHRYIALYIYRTYDKGQWQESAYKTSDLLRCSIHSSILARWRRRLKWLAWTAGRGPFR